MRSSGIDKPPICGGGGRVGLAVAESTRDRGCTLSTPDIKFDDCLILFRRKKHLFPHENRLILFE